MQSYGIIEMSYSIEQILANPWLGIQDIVGDAKKWPKFIRSTFWDRNSTDHKRMLIVNFAYVNGISPEFLHDVLAFTLKRVYTNVRRREIQDRFTYLNHEVIRSTLINESD